MRQKIYNLSPAVLNVALGVPEVVEDEVDPDLDEVISTHTAGNVETWLPKQGRLTSRLISLAFVLFHLITTNWIPTSNTTFVTKEMGILLYKLIKGLPVNLGARIFDHLEDFAVKGTAVLPYPALLFKVLTMQGYVPKGEDVFDTPGTMKITHIMLGGAHQMELPWIGAAEGVDRDDGTLTVPREVLQAQRDLIAQQIAGLK